MSGLRRAALAGRLPPSVWKRLPAPPTFDVMTPSGSFHYQAGEGDQWRRRLYWRGLNGAERGSLAAFARLARSAGHIADIGAYAGLYTLVACVENPQTRVWAFEPTPRSRDQLAGNLELNGFRDRVHLSGDAVADRVGSEEYLVPTLPMPPSARLVDSSYRTPPRGDRYEVATTTLDAAVSPPLNLVKIDVEGAEHRVIGGMSRHLQQARPAVLFEALPEGRNDMVNAAFVDAGYRFWLPTPAGLEERQQIEPDPDRQERNFLCVAPDGFGSTIVY